MIRRLIFLCCLALAACASGITTSAASPGFGTFGFRHHKVGTVTPSVLPPSGITYDASIGNGVDATGRTSLPLRSGASRYYVNSSTGSDTNTCTQAKTPSTPKATIESAAGCTVSGNGDQVLVAQGTSYANGFLFLTQSGFSAQYPTVYESYDPTDPTNEAKLGTAGTAGRPIVNTAGTVQQHFVQGATSINYVAVRGFDWEPGQVALTELTMVAPNNPATANYFLFENNIFHYTALDYNGNPTTLHAKSAKWIVRNNAFYDEFGDHAQGIYMSNVDGATIEDNIFWASGRLDSVARTAAVGSGGASIFNHAVYAQDNDVNMIVRRSAFVDTSTDGGNLKGGGIYTENLSIRNPNAFAMGAGDIFAIDAPLGVYMDASYNATVGSNSVPSGAIGWGMRSSNNGRPTSLFHHNVIVRNDQATLTNGAFQVNQGADNNGTTLPDYATFDHNVGYLWSTSGTSVVNSGGATLTLTNNIWDDPTSGSNTNNGSTVFSNAYTETSLLAALGYASESAATADWIAHPELHGWENAVPLMLAGYGVTKAQQDLKTDMRVTAGIAESGQFIGTVDGSTLSGTGLPACMTIDDSSKSWRTDATCTASSGTASITETNGANAHTTSIPWAIYSAPVLSGISVTPGTTTATVNVSTTVGSGNIYAIVDPTTTATIWPAIRAGMINTNDTGTPAAAKASASVTASGAQPGIAITGLTASTAYMLQIAQLDANNNPSAVGTFNFTTASNWTPASLGANLALDFTELDSSHLFQDTGCTTAVTTDGQTAKCIKDSTTGIIATNSTGWVYHANSGKPYLQMDGTSQFVTTTSVTYADASGQFTGWATLNCATSGALNAIYAGGPILQASQISAVGAVRSSSAQLAQASSSGTALNVDEVVSVLVTGSAGSGTVEAFVNNIDTPGTGAVAWTGTPKTSSTLNINPPSAPTGKFYGLLIAKTAVDSTTRTNVQAYMAGLHP